MKTLRNVYLLIVSLALIGLSNSCSNSSNAANSDTKKKAENPNDVSKAGDTKFVVDAEDINLMEMNLGQLAQSKAMMSETKDLGAMMYSDHKKAYDDLAALAAKKSITIPSTMTAAEQKEYNELQAKTGMNFDKAYCEKMVKGHKEAISEFEKESKDGTDPDVKSWAASMIPILQKHLDHSTSCLEKCKNKKSSS